MAEKRDLDKELEELIKSMPGAYEPLWTVVCLIAKKFGKQQEVIDYINSDEKPDCSDLVLFLETIDDSIPKSYEDSL